MFESLNAMVSNYRVNLPDLAQGLYGAKTS